MSTIAVSKANPISTPKTIASAKVPAEVSKHRIHISIPIQISGTDLNGQDFLERTRTESVCSSGAALVLNRFLGPDQQLLIRRNRCEVVATVVGQIGIRSNGFVYGIALNHEGSSFWGVHFPPGSESTQSKGIRCSCCMSNETAQLSEIEAAVLQANNLLSRACDECCAITFWQQCETSDPTPAANGSKANRRKNVRIAMKAAACLCQPTGLRDVAALLDISRGGICFRTAQAYTVHSWVELAVPYTEGGANIFVPGRIAWERPVSNGFREYGVQYVRN